MTKTLTEQWREGTLPLNHYYVKTKIGKYGIDNTVLTFDEDKPRTKLAYSDYTKEVLAPVPSYDEVKEMSQKIKRLEFDNEALEMAHNEGKEINAELEQYNKDLLKDHTRIVMECDRLLAENKQLEKRLEIATKALKEINKNYRFTVAQDVVYKALKEMEGVK